MRLRLRGDRIFVKPDENPTMTESGLHIVYDRQKRVANKGTVAAIGEGPLSRDGKTRLPHLVSVGDRIIFSPDAGAEAYFEKDVYINMREEDVLAVIEG